MSSAAGPVSASDMPPGAALLRAVAHKAARIVAADIGRCLRGEPLVHCANP